MVGKREQILAEVAEGKPKSQAAREYGISRATLYRMLEAQNKD
ncbi:helix-turn-helix domain-containing protein [Dermabacteraceae bacterium P13115]